MRIEFGKSARGVGHDQTLDFTSLGYRSPSFYPPLPPVLAKKQKPACLVIVWNWSPKMPQILREVKLVFFVANTWIF